MASIDVPLKAAADQKARPAPLGGLAADPAPVRRAQETPYQPLSAEQTAKLVNEILTPEQRTKLANDWEIDFAYEIPGVARFRSNAFQQRKGLDACFRVVRTVLPGFAELGIPEIMKKVCENHQGLILVTGSAGSGKSTTIA